MFKNVRHQHSRRGGRGLERPLPGRPRRPLHRDEEELQPAPPGEPGGPALGPLQAGVGACQPAQLSVPAQHHYPNQGGAARLCLLLRILEAQDGPAADAHRGVRGPVLSSHLHVQENFLVNPGGNYKSTEQNV